MGTAEKRGAARDDGLHHGSRIRRATYTVTVPELKVPRCQSCGELVLDSAANRQITEALRQHLRLLTPGQIRTNRETLGLTQRQLASHLGIAEATLSRWETGGQIQQRALDRLLRLYFSSPSVRATLADDDQLVELGTSARPHREAETDSVDTEQASRLSRLAQALEALPCTKRESAVQEFQHLMELMK